MSKGLLLSLVTVLLWAVESVFSRYAVSEWQVQPFVFTGVALLVGSVAMMLVGGRARSGGSRAWDRQTLAFSIFEVLIFLFFVFLVGQVSATEANFLNRISIPLVLVAGWLVFSRRPLPLDAPGIGLVLIGVVLLVSALEDSVRWPALGLSVLIGLCQVGRTMAAETHPGFGRAVSVADRCYVTGQVLAVTCVVFLLLSLALSSARHAFSGSDVAGYWRMAPGFSDFVHGPTLLLAAVMGLTLVWSMTYFYLYASRVARSEVFLAVVALLPFMTFLVEYLAGRLGLVDISTVGLETLLPGGLIVAGAVLIIYARRRPGFRD